MDGYPDLPEMVEAGMTLTEALALWGRMMRDPDRTSERYWAIVRTWRRAGATVQ